MKNLRPVKKIHVIITLLLMVVLLAEIACMFIPCWTFTPLPDRANPNPEQSSYSIMQYCWTDCAALNDYFTEQLRIRNYFINDHVTNIVISFATALLTIGFSVVFLRYELNRWVSTPYAVVCHGLGLIWSVFSLMAFLSFFGFPTATVLVKGDPIASIAPLICVCIGTVLVLVRIGLWIVGVVQDKKEKKRLAELGL